jgi:WD40 repeat protein
VRWHERGYAGSGATLRVKLNKLFEESEPERNQPKRLTRISKPATPPISVALADQKGAFIALRDGTILWTDQKRSVPLKIFPSPCRSIHLCDSLSRLFIVHADGSMSVLDRHEISRRKQIAALPENLSDGIADLSSGIAITSYRSGTVKKWNNATGNVTDSIELHKKEALEMDFNSNATKLASVGLDKKLIICDLPTLKTNQALNVDWGVRCVSFSPDGSMLAGPASSDLKTNLREGTFDLWDPNSGEMLSRFVGHKNWVVRFHFFEGGERLASLSVDGTVRIWDTANSDCVQTINFSSFGNAYCFAIDKESRKVAIGHSDGVVSYWSIESGQLVSSSIVGDSAVIGLRSLHSGDWIVFNDGVHAIKFFDHDFQPIVSLNACVGPIGASRNSGNALMLVGQSGLVRILKVD